MKPKTPITDKAEIQKICDLYAAFLETFLPSQTKARVMRIEMSFRKAMYEHPTLPYMYLNSVEIKDPEGNDVISCRSVNLGSKKGGWCAPYEVYVVFRRRNVSVYACEPFDVNNMKGREARSFYHKCIMY